MLKSRVEKVKGKVLFLLKQVLKITNPIDLPKPLCDWIQNTFKHGGMLSPKAVSQFELNYVYLDEHNTFYNFTQDTKDFLLLHFVFGKVLLGAIMLDPEGLGVKLSAKTMRNFKVIASVIYER